MDLATVRSDQVSIDNPDEGDLLLVDGTAVELTAADDAVSRGGAAAEGQAIEAGLRTQRGEWFLDLTAGVPYREEVLGVKGVTPPRVQQILATEIQRRGTVRSIEKLQVVLQGREALATFEATLVDGAIITGSAPIGGT